MKWCPVKSDAENPAHVTMHNFHKMHQMGKFYATSTKLTQNNKSSQF